MPENEFPPYKIVPLASLAPYHRNARTHSAEQVKQIADSMREFGWTNPMLIDESGNVIAGHGRLLAAELLGLTEGPAIEIAGLTHQQRRALILADNKIALNAGWDENLLRLELEELKLGGFDLQLTGFTPLDLDGILSPSVEPEPSRAGNLAAQFGIPPFSVLNAREGWWQDRKRAWLALGIQSELGRGGEGAANAIPGGGCDAAGSPSQAKPSNATPGGSMMPAADYRNRKRGDGRGRAV